jgi:hypothetical protein
MDNAAYAVHTRTCTFLLDAEGICRWIVSRTGMVPPEIRRSVGAQFVACIHPDLDGLLAGELVIGAAALFVKREPQGERFELMRSGTIVHIELRGAKASLPPPGAVLSDDTLDLSGGPPLSVPPTVGARGGDTVPPPSFALGSLSDGELEGLEIPAHDGESTVTLTLPLFRPEAPRRLPNR